MKWKLDVSQSSIKSCRSPLVVKLRRQTENKVEGWDGRKYLARVEKQKRGELNASVTASGMAGWIEKPAHEG